MNDWNLFNGWCLEKGHRPLELPEVDFLDLVLAWLMEGMDSKDITELERKLTVPPLGTNIDPKDKVWSRDAELGAFKALVGASGKTKVGRTS